MPNIVALFFLSLYLSPLIYLEAVLLSNLPHIEGFLDFAVFCGFFALLLLFTLSLLKAIRKVVSSIIEYKKAGGSYIKGLFQMNAAFSKINYSKNEDTGFRCISNDKTSDGRIEDDHMRSDSYSYSFYDSSSHSFSSSSYLFHCGHENDLHTNPAYSNMAGNCFHSSSSSSDH